MSWEQELGTRKKRIDPRLEAAGWRVVPYDRDRPDARDYAGQAVKEFPTSNGDADYGLCDDSVLGVVEAKKASLDPQGALTQAERYAKGLDRNPFNYGDGLRAPFLYSTNGEAIWFHDVRHPLNRSRQIAGFHTEEALRELLTADFDGALAALYKVPTHRLLRTYQREANEAVEKAIRERRRQMLLAMASGTGKTLTMVSQVYRLMKSGVAKRILFLVDRRALAAQAVRAFASFEAEPGLKFDKIYEVYSQRLQTGDFEESGRFDPKVLPNRYLTNPKADLAFVYVSTIQRISINLFGREAVFSGDETIDDDVDQLDIPIHAFDLTVADECHRGYTTTDTAVWRKTLDYFDAIKVGLTATPAPHTKAYFKDIVFSYPYERAVEQGYLVDYDAVKIESNVRMHGVFLEEGERVEEIDPETGTSEFDVLEDEREFDAGEIERKVTSPDSNQKIVEEIAGYAAEHEERYGRFPKTLIFAVNDLPHTSHCDQLVDIARDVFGRGDSFVQKITGRIDRPLQRIREFRNRPNPAVAVTVDMLTTGVDIPDLEFVVFLRPVKSRILFEQMMGRGTRLGENVPDKGFFTVFDCFDGTLLKYFSKTSGITAALPEGDGKSTAKIIDAIWRNEDRDYSIRRLVKRLQRVNKQMSGEAIELFARFIPEDLGSFAAGLPERLRRDFNGTMEILRSSEFLELLENYPRPARVFLVAPGVEDEVTSARLITAGAGKQYAPEDYLTAFDAFVGEHVDDVEAIAILLSRPSGWGTEPLKELREALSKAAEHFTEDKLQLAFRLTHKKALVDIISMVRHAQSKESELLTAEERVSLAVERITEDIELSDEQKQWLGYIRASIIKNLAVGKEDFDLIPVLSNRGGWRRADRVFDGKLEDLLSELNRALVEAA